MCYIDEKDCAAHVVTHHLTVIDFFLHLSKYCLSRCGHLDAFVEQKMSISLCTYSFRTHFRQLPHD